MTFNSHASIPFSVELRCLYEEKNDYCNFEMCYHLFNGPSVPDRNSEVERRNSLGLLPPGGGVL